MILACVMILLRQNLAGLKPFSIFKLLSDDYVMLLRNLIQYCHDSCFLLTKHLSFVCIRGLVEIMLFYHLDPINCIVNI